MRKHPHTLDPGARPFPGAPSRRRLAMPAIALGLAGALSGAAPALAVDPGSDAIERFAAPAVADGDSAFAPSNLLTDLQSFIRQRKVDVERLTADQMIALMVDWYRFAPVAAAGSGAAADALVYRYGGWSEGCATGFKLSLLRRAGERGAADTAERIAGITLMFEPSSGAKLAPFSTVSSDFDSIEGFLDAVQQSPAFRQFGTALPMAVMMERGALR